MSRLPPMCCCSHIALLQCRALPIIPKRSHTSVRPSGPVVVTFIYRQHFRSCSLSTERTHGHEPRSIDQSLLIDPDRPAASFVCGFAPLVLSIAPKRARRHARLPASDPFSYVLASSIRSTSRSEIYWIVV